jgi:hypothetical protein
MVPRRSISIGKRTSRSRTSPEASSLARSLADTNSTRSLASAHICSTVFRATAALLVSTKSPDHLSRGTGGAGFAVNLAGKASVPGDDVVRPQS